MTTFTREEQRLFIFVGALGLIASACSLCLSAWTVKGRDHATQRGDSPVSTPTTSALPFPTSTPAAPRDDRRVDPNFASYDELLAIPGIGPALARKILFHREQNIIFSGRDMTRIPGIGPKTWQRLAPHFAFGADESPDEDR